MSRNRFQNIIYSLHFVDNPRVSDDVKYKDKIWKLRPWLDAHINYCLAVTPGEHSVVDEMMVSYRAKRNPIRQYIKGNLTHGVLRCGVELVWMVYCMI